MSDSKPKTNKTLTEEQKSILTQARLSALAERPALDKTIRNRDRLPKEYPTRAAAIRNQCRHCVGYESDGHGSIGKAIEDCQGYECWLYPWRLGVMREDKRYTEPKRIPGRKNDD